MKNILRIKSGIKVNQRIEYIEIEFDKVKEDYKDMLLHLDASDKDLLILYAELGSYRKVGKFIGRSKSWAYNKIKKIRELC